MRMRQLLILLSLVLSQIAVSQGEGQFFFGLLYYKSLEGEVCCDNVIANETCTPYCNLMFEVHIQGLNGPDDDPHVYNFSSVPLTPAEAYEFRMFSASHLNNPMVFNFDKWLGSVNISVLVSNQENLTDPASVVQVEEFSTTLVKYKPGDYYKQNPVRNSDTGPELNIIFRYTCGATKGPECFTDCVDHNDSEICPVTSPSPVTPEITWTAPICETVDENGHVVQNSSCKVESTPKPTQNSTHTKYLDSGPTQSPSSNSSSGSLAEMTSDVPATSTSTSTVTFPTTTTITTTTTTTTSTAKTVSSTNKPTPTTTPKRTSTTLKRSDDPRATVTSDPTRGSTPDERATKNEEESTIKYWPAIVGGVLGGVAFIAAIGFFLYYRRQKKLRKRQEIYNVNPKVLRNFEEYAENGTSGRADVPLETEQY